METISGCTVAGPAHTVWNSGDRALRGLIFVSPGGAEHVFVPVESG